MPSSVLVGRAAELAEGQAAVDAALAGGGGLLLVTGEAGIGKTRLAEELAAYAEKHGAAVRWASCWEGEGAPAFWPFVQLLRQDPAACALGVLEEVETTDTGESARFQLFDTVSRCLSDSARSQPLVAVIDDLQWADMPSLLLLRFLAQAIRRVPLTIAATLRDAELARDPERAAIVTDLGSKITRVSLRGLDSRGVGELVEATIGASADPATAAAVHDHTDGNPFFVVQVARLLNAEGTLSTPRASGRLPLPDDVRAVLERRLARLSQPCHELLQVAAVAGKTFDAQLVSELAGVGQDGGGYLDEATFARVVHPTDGGSWQFAHDLVRETLYESLVPSLGQELHALVGEALERRYAGDVEPHLAELAQHFLRSGETGPGSAGVSYAARAGRRAMALLAYEEAAAHFERAVEALGPPTAASADERTALLLDLGEARLWSGDWEAATTTLNQAADIARARHRPHDLARAALGLGSGEGGFEVPLQDFSQVDLLEEALRALDGEESVLRARVLARLSVALAWIAPVERQIALAGEALELCRRLGDQHALVYILASWCDAIAGPDHIEERLEAATEMLDIAQRLGDREGMLLARRLRVVALLEQGDAAVDGEIEAFAVIADRLGAPLFRWYVPQFRGCRAAMAGRLDEVERLVLEVDTIGKQAQSENANMLAESLRVQLNRARGHYERLIQMLVVYLEAYGMVAPTFPWAALSYAENGEPERGLHFLEQLAIDDFARLDRNSEWLPSMAFAAEAAMILGATEIAAPMYRLLVPYGARFAVDGILGSCLGAVDRYLGQLAELCGRHDDATAHYKRAIESNARAGAPLFVAYTELDYGRCLLARGTGGDRERGMTLVQRAEAALKTMDVVIPRDPRAATVPALVTGATNEFRWEGAVWSLSFGGTTVTVLDAKGLHDLAALLARPGTEVAAAELAGAPAVADVSMGADTMLDDKARAAYKRRLHELEEELAEAEEFNDTERASRAREERDFLAAELAAALGLGGRERQLAAPAERARKAVTMRIRNSVGRIAKVHPQLARHLEKSVRTGTFCCYEPERLVEWLT